VITKVTALPILPVATNVSKQAFVVKMQDAKEKAGRFNTEVSNARKMNALNVGYHKDEYMMHVTHMQTLHEWMKKKKFKVSHFTDLHTFANINDKILAQ